MFHKNLSIIHLRYEVKGKDFPIKMEAQSLWRVKWRHWWYKSCYWCYDCCFWSSHGRRWAKEVEKINGYEISKWRPLSVWLSIGQIKNCFNLGVKAMVLKPHFICQWDSVYISFALLGTVEKRKLPMNLNTKVQDYLELSFVAANSLLVCRAATGSFSFKIYKSCQEESSATALTQQYV